MRVKNNEVLIPTSSQSGDDEDHWHVIATHLPKPVRVVVDFDRQIITLDHAEYRARFGPLLALRGQKQVAE